MHQNPPQPANPASPTIHNSSIHNSSIHQQPSPIVERTNSFDYTPSASVRPVETRTDSLGRNSTVFSPRVHEPPQPHHQVEDEHEPDDIHSALRQNGANNRNSASSAWGVYDGGSNQRGSFGGETGAYNPSVFSEPVPGMGPRHGSFGGLGGIPNPVVPVSGSVGVPTRGPEEVVTVTVLPEKEGMFMFQHRNYQIASTRRGSRVVRRYSDFVW